MSYFRETTHLSEILDESNKNAVIIFIYSSECNTSSILSDNLEKWIVENNIQTPRYKVTVQKQPALSQKIEQWFNIKHESPQIIIVNKGKVTYTAHHHDININNFIF